MSLVRGIRAGRNWTQAELARRAGISRSSVAAIENGVLVPLVHTALARSLDCTVEELFGDKGEGTISKPLSGPGGQQGRPAGPCWH